MRRMVALPLIPSLHCLPIIGGAVGALDRLCARSFLFVSVCLFFAELALNGLIVWRVPYTEIDWIAYMDEVGGVIGGDYNYTHLKGPTGPLVYPGGFVWFYMVLSWMTDAGANVPRAQAIFVAFYMTTFSVVAAIYARAAPKLGFHPLGLLLLCCSKRIHSIFSLRLFNDGPCMLLLYMSVLIWLQTKPSLRASGASSRSIVFKAHSYNMARWTAGCLIFSFAFGIKMNIVLFSPALALLLFTECGASVAILNIVACGIVQLAIAWPFLMHDPVAYLTRSFDIGRTFTQKWSVNFKWVPCTPLPAARLTLLEDCEGPFTSKAFARVTLLCHVFLLFMFFHYRFCAAEGGLFKVIIARLSPPGRRVSDHKANCEPVASVFDACQTVTMLFVCNFIGVACAKSLHFQFYVWYFHSLPLLLWCTRFPTVVKLALWLAIEAAWNPWAGETSSVASSVLLTASHAILMAGLWDGLGPGKLGVFDRLEEEDVDHDGKAKKTS